MKEKLTLLILLFSLHSLVFADEYKIPKDAWSVCAADIDLDGDMDLIIGHLVGWGAERPTITIMKNNGTGGFTFYDTSWVFCGYQENIFTLDMNNDNYPDIIAFRADFSLDEVRRYIRIIYNIEGNFIAAADFSLERTETFSDITHGDLNGDGLEDVVVGSNKGRFWGVLYNNGNGGLTKPEYYSVDFPLHAVHCGNLNGDIRQDVIVTGQYLNIYLSDETGFELQSLPHIRNYAEIVDLDDDGDNDILTTDVLMFHNCGFYSIHTNNGNNEFTILDSVFYEPGMSKFLLCDMDNDNLKDMVFSANPGIYVMLYKNNYVFSQPQYSPLENYDYYYNSACCADFDGNGYPDVATVRYFWGDENDPNLTVLFNDSTGHMVDHSLTGINETHKPSTLINNFRVFPSPFHKKTGIYFSLNEPAQVKLQIFNIKGRLVNQMSDLHMPAGKHNFSWNGRFTNGKKCPAGLYFVRLTINKQNIFSNKILLLN